VKHLGVLNTKDKKEGGERFNAQKTKYAKCLRALDTKDKDEGGGGGGVVLKK